MLQKQRLTKDQAFQKIKHFCAYQERSHTEVRDKLYSFGLWQNDVEQLIAQLIEEDYLNEERFARLFTGGRFRMKQWGRIKIKYELKQRKVSPYCILQGLKEIDDEAYEKTLEKLAGQKWLTLKSEKNLFVKKRKTTDYLLQKGYEHELITEAIKSLNV